MTQTPRPSQNSGTAHTRPPHPLQRAFIAPLLPLTPLLAYLLIAAGVAASLKLNLAALPSAEAELGSTAFKTLLTTHLLAYFAIAGLLRLLLPHVLPRKTADAAIHSNSQLQTEAECHRRLAMAFFESATEAIMIVDSRNRIVMINPAFTRITGYSEAEAIGQSSKLLSSGKHDRKFYEDMWRSILQTGGWAGEIWNRRKDGSPYVEWLTITTLLSSEEEAVCSFDLAGSYVATFTDITQRKEAEDRLRFKANHDMLTGLPNRNLFEDHLQLALSHAKRYQRRFALLYIDLDFFKNVNDTMGHAAGDVLLSEAGKRMSLCVRESDTLARLGGDEFAALLSEVNSMEEIEEIARRIVSVLDEPFQLEEGLAKISGSVGIALYPQHGDNTETLKRRADLALYAVKKSSRNAYLLYTPAMETEAETESATAD